jgi:hypothetical protein
LERSQGVFMARVHVSNICAECGTDISDKENFILTADVQWSDIPRRSHPYSKRQVFENDKSMQQFIFKQSKNTRNAYCDVFCLKRDLEKHLPDGGIN